MKKTVKIDDHDVVFVCNAATYAVYRETFNRDLIKEIRRLDKAKDESGTEEIEGEALELFERLAYTMAKQADPDIPELTEWLGQFEQFSFYEIALPQVAAIWEANQVKQSTPKKKATRKQTGK